MGQPLLIDLVADVVCPWCYLGWRRVKSAVALRPDVEPLIVWRPYQLDPSLPEQGVDRKAYMAGKFKDAVIPVVDRNGQVVLDHDELIRPGTTAEGLAGLKPSFVQHGQEAGFDDVALSKYHWLEKIDHVHHAGNSSGIVDGSALMLIGSEEVGKELGLTPRAKIISAAVSGADPTIMLTGPAPAARKALAKAGLTVEDIDLFEINEAFAAVAMRFMRDMGISHEITNVNGGAIAMGHPLGATGAIILGTLVDELQARGKKRGLATLCVGGGMGIATIVELV